MSSNFLPHTRLAFQTVLMFHRILDAETCSCHDTRHRNYLNKGFIFICVSPEEDVPRKLTTNGINIKEKKLSAIPNKKTERLLYLTRTSETTRELFQNASLVVHI